MTSPPRPSSRSGRRSWAMAVAAAAVNFMSFGLLLSFGLFLTPLSDEFDASTGAVALVFSGSVLCYYVAGAVGGSIGDRIGARPLVAFGAASMSIGLWVGASAASLWQLFVVYVPLVGLAVGACYAPLIGAVGRAMPDRRGLGIGVVLTGVGGGTLAMPLIIRALLDRGDWRSAFRTLAVVVLVILAAATIVIDDRGRGRTGGSGSSIWRVMLASPRFRLLYGSIVLIAPGFYAPLTFLNDYAIDRGIDPGRAALLVGAIGFGSVATRIAFGAVAPRLGPLRQYQLSHGLFLVALTIWSAADGRPAVLLVSAVLHGVAWAAWVTATPLVLADWFGVDDLGSTVGGLYTGLGVGAVIGPPISGAIIDAWGHRPALATLLATTAASLVVLALAARSSVTGDGDVVAGSALSRRRR